MEVAFDQFSSAQNIWNTNVETWATKKEKGGERLRGETGIRGKDVRGDEGRVKSKRR